MNSLNRIIPIAITLFALNPIVHAEIDPVYKVFDFDAISYESLNQNSDFEAFANDRFSGVQRYGRGYRVAENQGRNDSTAALCDNPDGDGALGLSWSFQLDQTHPEPVRTIGWSKAENVEGSPESNYSLYIDIIYTDGTPSWGHNAPFQTGSHDWQEERLLVLPEKPIQRISCYALFRNKKGRVWFDDISIQKAVLQSGSICLDGLSVRKESSQSKPAKTERYESKNLSAAIDPSNGSLASLKVSNVETPLNDSGNGFLLRDVAEGSGYYAFRDGLCEPLNGKLQLTVTDSERAIHFQGTIEDASKTPRALNLLYALPVNMANGRWGDSISQSRTIAPPEDYHAWVQIGTGSNGRLSRYPFACLYNNDAGLALGFDMGKPCQWRLGYSSDGGLLYLSMDFGLHPETTNFPSKASFHFVLYSIEPQWGFRSAANEYYEIFPDYFEVRSKDQGIWMPFTDVGTVEGWQDFGFKYHEGNNNVSFDDSADILSFRYTEPSTWWMNMDAATPRTYDAAIEQVHKLAESTTNSSLRKRAQSLLASGSYDEDGKFQMQFRNEPWSNGAVFSLNASPYIPGEYTNASLMWNDDLAQQLYGPNTKGTLDGEYLDSLEAYVTADLNFRPDHFRYLKTPPTFTLDTRRPVIHKAFTQYEFTRHLSEEMHSRGKLLFANSVPSRFSFLCPWIDVMGTETNWIGDGKFAPNSDEVMCYRRTLVGQKPYLFLMNTNFNYMTYEIVEQYFQHCLFYGMFPSMFSHNAAEDPYWKNPTLYNRDRPLFKKYQPLIKQVAEAGWEAIPMARCNREDVRIERFGRIGDGKIYLTVLNQTGSALTLSIRGEEALDVEGQWKELITGKEGTWKKGLENQIDAQAVQVYSLFSFENETSVQGATLN